MTFSIPKMIQLLPWILNQISPFFLSSIPPNSQAKRNTQPDVTQIKFGLMIEFSFVLFWKRKRMEKARVAHCGGDRLELEMIQSKTFLRWWQNHIFLLPELIRCLKFPIPHFPRHKDWEAYKVKLWNLIFSKDSANIKKPRL